jgi:hypothetical protein
VRTTLRFTAGDATFEPDLFKHAVTATIEKRLGDRWTLQFGAGATIAGELRIGGDAYTFDPGPLASIAASYRFVDERKSAPFVIGSMSLGASYGVTHVRGASGDPGASFTAFDGRVGVAVGKTIARTVSPYLLARAFGLPVLWTYRGADAVGTDTHHYQLGAGTVLRLGRFDLSAEIVPLGERAIVAGGGFIF